MAAASHPHLRLVGGADPLQLAADAVASENRAARANAGLDPADPRWVLATRAYAQLQGSTMTPDRRQRVMRTADQLGVRPFEANLIIAIVQDHARSGRVLADAAPTLQLLAEPEPKRRSAWDRWIAALVLATLANLLLIWWLVS